MTIKINHLSNSTSDSLLTEEVLSSIQLEVLPRPRPRHRPCPLPQPRGLGQDGRDESSAVFFGLPLLLFAGRVESSAVFLGLPLGLFGGRVESSAVFFGLPLPLLTGWSWTEGGAE